ncbi:MAG: SAP domain-containing protein [Nanoarchaeota archaeon]
MKLEEIVSKMTTLYLRRLVGSFLKDPPRDNEKEMRKLILKNKNEFADYDRIKNKMNFIHIDRNTRVLNNLLLHILLNENDYKCEKSELIQKVKQKEKEILKNSQKEGCLKFSDAESLNIYKKVLITAWKWQDDISPHEQNILNTLREELNISKKEHRLIESKLGYFPQKGNKIHGYNPIKESLKDLQYRGLITRFKDNNSYFAIPEEIANSMKNILGIELKEDTYKLLLKKLKKSQLKTILKNYDFPYSGTKKELYTRILKAQIKPSMALNQLTKDELREILLDLEDANISGTKEERINNIIKFYDNLITYNVESNDPREIYYNYIEELANREYKQLRGNNIIDKDLSVEHYFEEATNFLFEKILGHTPTKMKGNDNPDGRLICENDEVILWDNKSCESDYNFPDKHFNQFKRYIREEKNRVTLFLIIAPSFTSDCLINAQKLKAQSNDDTDVGLITAKNIKFVAENWKKYCSGEYIFDLQVFNLTGYLTKEVLEQRMKWAL